MAKTSLEKSKIKILLLEGVHQSAVDNFHNAGYENIELLPTSLDEEALIEKIVAHELKSPVQLEFEREGVRCVMRVPVRRRHDFQIRQSV